MNCFFSSYATTHTHTRAQNTLNI